MKSKAVVIPASIAKTFEEYGFAVKLETAVAIRSTDEWFAILFKDRKEFWAVDFLPAFEGGWEVSNDYVGPFESVEAFLTERLTRSFI